jgi:triosephosphate isomerase
MGEQPTRTLIAGNWKMHGLQAQLVEIEEIAQSIREDPFEVDVLVCFPAPLIASGVHAANKLIQIGGQYCSAEQAGPFTGDIDAEMLRDAGAESVNLGHSERRQWHHETDPMVAAKAKAAWKHGLGTIICIGETLAQCRAGDALPASARTSIAYEPLRAIRSGTTPTRDGFVAVLAYIRAALESRFGKAARLVRILYCGSAEPGNAGVILDTPKADGILVGGASLFAADLNAILDVSRPPGGSRSAWGISESVTAPARALACAKICRRRPVFGSLFENPE